MDLRGTRFVISVPGAAERPLVSLDVREVRLARKIRRYGLSLESHAVLDADLSDHPRLVVELWVDVGVHDAHGSPRELGRAIMPEPLVFEAPSAHVPQQALGDWRTRLASLSVEASPDQIDEIEELRDGRDLVLGLSPGGLAHIGGEVHRLYPSNHQLTVTVPQSNWARLIQGASYASILTVELALPDVGLSGDLDQAVRAVRNAQAAYRRGDYEEAVADCREGLAVLTRSGDDRFDMKGWSRSAGKEERFWRAQRAVLHVTHAAHHPEDQGLTHSQADEQDEPLVAIEWGRADAHSVIVMLAALISQRVRGA